MRCRMMVEGEEEMEKNWKEICNVVLGEDARGIDFSDHVDSLSLTDFIIQVNGTCRASSDSGAHVEVNGIQIPNIIYMKKEDTDLSSGNLWRQIYNIGRIVCGTEGNGTYGSMTSSVRQSAHILLPDAPYTSIRVSMAGTTQKMSAGTQFILYGR